MIELNKIYNEECLEGMKQIPDGSVDMILCDLPYGTTSCAWDEIIPFEPLWKQYERVIKDNGAIVLTASQPFTSKLVMSNIKWFKHEWIWEKQRASNFMRANHEPLKYHENVCVFYSAQPTYNPIFENYSESTNKRFSRNGKVNSQKMVSAGYINEIQNVKKVNGEINIQRGAYPKSIKRFSCVQNANKTRVHPTQKPVALMEYLIRTYTNEGDTVLDFTMGSGTTGVAAMHTGRNFIGIEMDAGYFAIAEERIAKAAQMADGQFVDKRGKHTDLDALPMFAGVG